MRKLTALPTPLECAILHEPLDPNTTKIYILNEGNKSWSFGEKALEKWIEQNAGHLINPITNKVTDPKNLYKLKIQSTSAVLIPALITNQILTPDQFRQHLNDGIVKFPKCTFQGDFSRQIFLGLHLKGCIFSQETSLKHCRFLECNIENTTILCPTSDTTFDNCRPNMPSPCSNTIKQNPISFEYKRGRY